jgi:hypothetical protein
MELSVSKTEKVHNFGRKYPLLFKLPTDGVRSDGFDDGNARSLPDSALAFAAFQAFVARNASFAIQNS